MWRERFQDLIEGREKQGSDAGSTLGAGKASTVPAADVSGERIIVFRPDALHPSLSELLDLDSPLRSCLFWIAPPDSRATQELCECVAEPERPTAAVEAGYVLARTLGRAASQCLALAEIIAEGCEGGRMTMGCRAGFHAGDADEARRWLEQRGCELLPASRLLDQLAFLALETPDGAPPTSTVQKRSHSINRDMRETLQSVGEGLYVIDRSDPANEHFTLYNGADGPTYFGRHPGPGERWLDLALGHLPGGQITRVRFPDVSGLAESGVEPTERPPDTVVVGRLSELPRFLTAGVAVDSPLWSSLFWVAPSSCRVLDALFDALPEPRVLEASLAMRVCRQLERHVSDVCPGRLGDLAVEGGFHAGDADEVEAWIRRQDGICTVRFTELTD